jgi:AraC-like DNA-binding protein
MGRVIQNGKPCACGREVTHCHWVNSSRLLCEPKRLPLPEAPVPPKGAKASLFSVWSLTCTMPVCNRSATSRPRSQLWSVSGYIRHERLEAVRRDLQNPALTHRSVAALAARWCFVDAAHFSLVFRESYGFPPSQARAGASCLPSR